MICRVLVAVLFLLPVGAWAQTEIPTEIPDDDGFFSLTPELDLDLDLDLDMDLEGIDPEALELTDELGDVEAVEQPQATLAEGAVLRGLDKLTGDLTDLEMTSGQTQGFGRLEVTLGECRFPAGNPAGDAYAFLTIRPGADEPPVFEGWMIASSPALNALDHPRYDIWVLRCTTS